MIKLLAYCVASIALCLQVPSVAAFTMPFAPALPTTLADNEVLSILQVSNHATLELAKIAKKKTTDSAVVALAERSISQAQANLSRIHELASTTHLTAKPSVLSDNLFKQSQNTDNYFRSLSAAKFSKAYQTHDKVFHAQLLHIIEANLYPNIHSALLLEFVRQYQKQIEATK